MAVDTDQVGLRQAGQGHVGLTADNTVHRYVIRRQRYEIGLYH